MCVVVCSLMVFLLQCVLSFPVVLCLFCLSVCLCLCLFLVFVIIFVCMFACLLLVLFGGLVDMLCLFGVFVVAVVVAVFWLVNTIGWLCCLVCLIQHIVLVVCLLIA